jgi:DNA-directed RNA polymerase II subunit RPB1
MSEIGQSADLLSKSVMIGQERVSETERVLVNNDGLINLNWLKIQSNLIGNYRDMSGDEMNIFTPQELDAMAELANLATVKHNVMTSQSTKNVICITQDALLGCYLMTKDDKEMSRERFFDICMKGDGWTSEKILKGLDRVKRVAQEEGYKNFPLYCGKSLLSIMFPETLNYYKKNDARPDQPAVKIIKGVLLEGAINKAQLGQGHNTLIHVIHKEYGIDACADLINNCQFLPNQFLLHRSFTVGIKDCIADISSQTEEIAYKCFIEAKDTETTISHERIRELKICAILDKARDMSMKLAKSEMLKKGNDNAFVDTVTSGAKGEYFNLAQITSMLGQQMHLGKRIQKSMNRGKRVLPHYPTTEGNRRFSTKGEIPLEQEYESQGFIKNSFLHGMNPLEFYAHSVAGREGCANTALNTANSGYVQRRLIKLSEDIQVAQDSTVRMGNGNVLQWSFGGDGFDRSNCAFKNGETTFCDVDNIANMLNNEVDLEDI